MRTRRSARNQTRLWRALGGPAEPARPPIVTMCCWNCRNYPAGGRMRGACAVTGKTVLGESVRGCWRERERA